MFRQYRTPNETLSLLTKNLYSAFQTVNDYLNISKLAIVELLRQTMQGPNVVGYDRVVILD